MDLKDKNNNVVKKTRISSESEIYNKNRTETPNKEEFDKLSKKDKFLYFKEYYLSYVLIVLVIIIAGTYVVSSLKKANRKKDTFYCGMMAGVQFNQNVMEVLPKEFSEYLANEADYKGYNNPDDISFDVYYATITDDIRLDGFYDKGRFDVFITRANTFEQYVAGETIMDLSSVLSKELMEKLDDKIIYASVDSGEQIPYGILLDNIRYKFYDGAGDEIDPPILSIPSNTKRLDAAIAFIEFITR